MNNILEFNNVDKYFNSLKVLEDTTFHIGKDELVCLLGPSGSGKTTIFNIAAGLINPDRGEKYVSHEMRTGYVFQEARLLPWKTVAENLDFIQQNYLKTKKAEEIKKTLLELTGLKGFENSYPSQLSGGMKQRLEIIKALAIKPDLLLMDEPFKSVDAQTRVNLQNMILRFQEKRKLSIFLITHNPEEAVLMADRIYVLSRKPGTIVKEITLDIPQSERTLKDEKIYKSMQEIIELFMDLVGEFRWKPGSETEAIFEKIYNSKRKE